ncbi:hypothetical protein L1049_009841 [Liquidambar formosana]|uniref:Uncharacterized protein n=1 Tax=Liquidambar formosana TaxID=63359 RepID=A0AAP0N6J4_LIQFO
MQKRAMDAVDACGGKVVIGDVASEAGRLCRLLLLIQMASWRYICLDIDNFLFLPFQGAQIEHYSFLRVHFEIEYEITMLLYKYVEFLINVAIGMFLYWGQLVFCLGGGSNWCFAGCLRYWFCFLEFRGLLGL